MDVHKDSIQMAILGTRGKEPLLTKEVANRATAVVKVLTPYLESGAVIRPPMRRGAWDIPCTGNSADLG